MAQELLEIPIPVSCNHLDTLQDMPEDNAYGIRDMLVYKAGKIFQRGPVKAATTFLDPIASSQDGLAIVSTINLSGEDRIGVITHKTSDNTIHLHLLSAGGTSVVADFVVGNTNASSDPVIICANAALGGGLLIGIARRYKFSPTGAQYLTFWLGAAKANYTTGTMSCTRNSTVVTGVGTSWTANVESGMFLLGPSSRYIGVVDTVNSDTSITLKEFALATLSGSSYTLTSIRSPDKFMMISKGVCTTATNSSTITGADTKWKDQSAGLSGTWSLFRAKDLTFVGDVTTAPTSNTSMTLTANAAISMNKEKYVAMRQIYGSSNGSDKPVGFLNDVWASRQWFANNHFHSHWHIKEEANKVWFSNAFGWEQMDLSLVDGDYFSVPGKDPIIWIAATAGGLAILKEDSLWVIRGSSPSNFTLDKIADIGCICGMAVQKYNEGIVFPGTQGLWFFNGTELTEVNTVLSDRLRLDIVENIDTTRYWSALYGDHYIFAGPSLPIYFPVGSIETYPYHAILVHLSTGNYQYLTNFRLRGFTELVNPINNVIYIYGFHKNGASAVTLGNLRTLLDYDVTGTVGVDDNSGAEKGPKPAIQTKAYGFSDLSVIKHWKEILYYLRNSAVPAGSATIQTWYSPGQDFPPATQASNITEENSLITPRRVLFDARDRFVQFLIIGGFAQLDIFEINRMLLRAKLLRPGRIKVS